MKPMLAGKVDKVEKLRYPCVVQPKIDGIRCLMVDGVAMSRKLLPIPNEHIGAVLYRENLPPLDGELVIPGRPFNEVSGAIMSEDGKPDFRYMVFDIWGDPRPYAKRLMELNDTKWPKCIEVIESKVVGTADELLLYEDFCLQRGYEGVIVRSVDGKYKQGRSTTNEGYLLKLKRMEDAEAKIVAFEEEEQNNNVATRDALGNTKRSSHASGKEGKGSLGAFICYSSKWADTFKVGTGFTAEQRDVYWRGRDLIKGKTIKYRYQAVGSVDKPRFPSFLGFRDERDM